MIWLLGFALAALLASSPVYAGSLKDIEHVVIFMQENRAQDTYFGSMAGVRGFNDPNVQVNADGLSVWNQQVDPDMSDRTNTLLPFYLGWKGGETLDSIQCMAAGDNGYYANQAAYNHGLNNHWALNNTPWSWGYYKRDDIPVQFAIAEGWTSADMYQESQITATNPNRVTLVSGSINVPGGPQQPHQGGVYIDNNEMPGMFSVSNDVSASALTKFPGCEKPGVSCYPLKWKTIFEFYEEAGVSWQLYQDTNNFDDNPLAWFYQFQKADKDHPLTKKGMSFVGLNRFYEDAAKGTLPEVSFIVGPTELSEHPPYMPKDGGWLQKKVTDAVTSSPKYSSTLLMISFDETGGFGDHVTPFHPPPGTPGEWMKDPYGVFGDVFVGPGEYFQLCFFRNASDSFVPLGFRVPFVMVSPWTRGNRVFTERCDHNSQILFVEQWLTARGYSKIQTDQMVPWRRAHMSNLVNALDLDHPDYSLPHIPDTPDPQTDNNGNYIGTSQCQSRHRQTRPPVPYGEQSNVTEALYFEDGFKEVIGYLTEGRYLVFEKNRRALRSFPGHDHLTTSPSRPEVDRKEHRWILWYTEDEESEVFNIQSALDGRWIGTRGEMHSDKKYAARIRIIFLGNGLGYNLQYANNGQYIDMDVDGNLRLHSGQDMTYGRGFHVWSVTYHN
ncbi:hypothetical protein N7532_007950 [Penicillium argentinense]|uniref:Non-hemolytic phospholipase C n=1 Tax=Penicillium argentinense TaxID=1131581 RepID=A0A9W9K1J5_9EURO|nr:uncharacterized protein N7532_007950 [Penicillium argentinense]KAJ5089266.1 hypothetical protein N7532_007950 [Penicillium argentinense]